MLFRRNDVAWLSARSWRAETRMRDISVFRQAKLKCDPELIVRVGELLAGLIRQVRGRQCADAVTSVPCGHSCRHDCFGKQLAQAVAKSLDLPFVQVFADRFCSGVSHPKEYRKLGPLEQISTAPASLLLVCGTSGVRPRRSLGSQERYRGHEGRHCW
jgi:hypothetical protein